MTTADKIELGQGNPLFSTQFRALSEGIAGNGILAAGDLAVFADPDTALGVLVEPGGLRYDGVDYALDAQASLSVAAGDTDFDRWDIVVFDTGTGSPVVHEGTAEKFPTPPALGTAEFLLALVYVPTEASTIPAENVLNARATHQGAEAVRVADEDGNFEATTVEGVLAEVAGGETPAFDAEDSGRIDVGDAATLYTTELADGETLSVRSAALTLADGRPAPAGMDLVLVTLDNAGGGTVQTTVLAGDGATVYDRATGSPLAAYTNESGGAQTVGLLADNGHFDGASGGSGRPQPVFVAVSGGIS